MMRKTDTATNGYIHNPQHYGPSSKAAISSTRQSYYLSGPSKAIQRTAKDPLTQKIETKSSELKLWTKDLYKSFAFCAQSRTNHLVFIYGRPTSFLSTIKGLSNHVKP